MAAMTRPRATLGIFAGLTLTLALVAAACGSDSQDVASTGGPSTSAGDTATSSSPADAVTGDTMTGDTLAGPAAGADAVTWARVDATPDLASPVVAQPDEIVPDPDHDDVVLVHFYGGVQDCYGARATVVRQDDEVVKIKLETGSLPDAGDRACIEIAEAQELVVPLDAPVGDRQLKAVPAP